MKKLSILFWFISLTIYSDDFFSDFSTDDGESGSSVEISGSIDIGARGYFSSDILSDTPDINPNGLLTLSYKGSVADLTLTTKANYDSITLDELFTNIYFDRFNIEAGVFKTVWGKGDRLHVVDLLNPIDYSEYFLNDYLENKIPQTTLKVNFPLGESGLLELVYIPTLKGDKIPTTSRWATTESKLLYTTLVQVAGLRAEAASSILESVQILQNMDAFYQDTDSLDFGQFGSRVTSTFNGLDIGGLYYFGWDKQPNLNISKMMLEYEKMQMVGLEFGGVLYGFNLRGEAAYYFMDSSDDSFNYLGGFDYNLPLHNLNFNIQIKGNLFIDSDEDIQTLLVGKLSDSFNHEKTAVAVTSIYYIEDQCIMVKPEISTKIGDTITLELVSAIFEGNNGLFSDYDNNDFVSININYMF